MTIDYLADYPHLIPTVAQWYHDEWGWYMPDKTLEEGIKNLEQTYLNKDQVPLMFVAHTDGKPQGVVQLKYHEMTIYPEKEHWLGGVYVAATHRGNGIARQKILQLLEKAKALGVNTLYLQTENLSGGLYRQLGWEPLEQVNYHGVEVLVMEKQLFLNHFSSGI